MNDLQLHIYQLLQEMDSSENDQIEEVTIENVEKSKGKSKEKFLTLSTKSITLGKRSPSASQEVEEKPEIMNLLHIVETPEGVNKTHISAYGFEATPTHPAEPAKERESIKDKE